MSPDAEPAAATEPARTGPPLTTLRRGLLRVELHDGLEMLSRADGPLRFRRAREAASYLSPWRRETAAMGQLRTALARCERGARLAALSDEQVIDALAVHLANGNLSIIEQPIAIVPSSAAIATAEQAAAAAAAVAALDLPVVAPPPPPKAPPVPVLAALEDVQIEGAEVLPEVNQSLEQIDLTIANAASATTSLEPAPSGVPPIGAALDDASTSVTSTLDDL